MNIPDYLCAELTSLYMCGNDHITNNSKMCPCGDTYLIPLHKIVDQSLFGASYLDDYREHTKWAGLDS